MATLQPERLLLFTQRQQQQTSLGISAGRSFLVLFPHSAFNLADFFAQVLLEAENLRITLRHKLEVLQ